MMNSKVVPDELKNFAESQAQDCFSTSQEIQDYVNGFVEGFKSALLHPTPNFKQFTRLKCAEQLSRK